MSNCPCGSDECAAREYDPTRGPRLDANYRGLVAHLNELTAAENTANQQRWLDRHGIEPVQNRDAGRAR
jgi:hypothetical protein